MQEPEQQKDYFLRTIFKFFSAGNDIAYFHNLTTISCLGILEGNLSCTSFVNIFNNCQLKIVLKVVISYYSTNLRHLKQKLYSLLEMSEAMMTIIEHF
jgi:hypothetical protein